MDIAAEQVGRLEGALLIDVREDYEWEVGRIPGARHVPLADVAAAAETIERAAPVVFVCRIGGRSMLAANAFRRAGYEAYSLAGGVLEWQARGLPFEGQVAAH
jgi:rhodanese-related sulfurtransferase